MRKFLLIAGAAMLAAGTTVPAAAQSGKAKAQASAKAKPGKSMKASTAGNVRLDSVTDRNSNGIADWRERNLADANANGIPDYRERNAVDINRNGVADWRERWIDRNRDGIDDRAENQYSGYGCPPGLAKKSPACVPPGQAKKMWNEGERLPLNYRYYTDYADLPESYRTRYPYDDDYRYVYQNDRVYVIDAVSRAVRTIVNLF